jgi:hypothetical protein
VGAPGATERGVPLREQEGLPPPATPENSSLEGRRKRRVMGGELPARGGIPRPPYQEPQRRKRSRRPWWAWKRPPPGVP